MAQISMSKTNQKATCSRCESERGSAEISLHDGECASCFASHTDGCECEICIEWNQPLDDDEEGEP